MTVTNQVQTQEQTAIQPNDKEYNFSQIRQQLDRERAEKQQMQARIAEAEERATKLERMMQERSRISDEEDEDDNEPYVAPKRLKKETRKMKQEITQETSTNIERAVQKALEEERKRNWLDQNPDFYEIMNHTQTFAEKAPNLAKYILEMPDGFERQKLVYENIKTLGMHRKEEPKQPIQEVVDQKRHGMFYQPSAMGAPPYGTTAGGKNYTPAEGKNAYEKIKQLQATLRLQ